MLRFARILLPLVVIGVLAGCSLKPPAGFTREQHVDIHKYMGPWYVIAHIPPSKTRNAYNEIERYTLTKPNTVKTVFTYREGGFNGKMKTLRPTATVIPDTGNAVWGMEFFWPIKLQYVISYVSPDYKTTIVARSKRDYVWIMARKPHISKAKYQSLVKRVSQLGYDTSKLRRVPQQPLSQRDDLKVPPKK